MNFYISIKETIYIDNMISYALNTIIYLSQYKILQPLMYRCRHLVTRIDM